MNKKIIALLLVISALLSILAGCGGNPAAQTPTAAPSAPTPTEPEPTQPFVDYAGQVKFDVGSTQTVKVKVTGIKSFIDGDTTHFYVPTTVSETGFVKARYIGVNTPESTGKIEPWGKAASEFTKSKLETAQEIWIESDDDKWNIDSTGERHVVWVWYKPAGSDTYRNLNVELIQEGLSLTASGGNARYGQQCFDANIQAQAHKLVMYSGKDDPDFWYGDAVPITLISLCTNLELYKGKKVVFEGEITYDMNNNVYVQDYDPETDMYYGITVYYGYGIQGEGLEILSPGNRVKIVGVVQYSEGWGWQVSDIFFNEFNLDHPNNIKLIEKDIEIEYKLITPADLKKTVSVEVIKEFNGTETEVRTFKYGELALSSGASMENLYVERYEVNDNETSKSKGALTLYCVDSEGNNIQIYTANVLRDEVGAPLSGELFKGKTINVKGIVSKHAGVYQISVFVNEDITIVG